MKPLKSRSLEPERRQNSPACRLTMKFVHLKPLKIMFLSLNIVFVSCICQFDFWSNIQVISRTPVEGLPEGWIKEVRVRKNGPPNKKDPVVNIFFHFKVGFLYTAMFYNYMFDVSMQYYLDPLSEYVFLSKKDALRYLESGDVMKCVMRPYRRNVNNDDIVSS